VATVTVQAAAIAENQQNNTSDAIKITNIKTAQNNQKNNMSCTVLFVWQSM